MKDWIGLIWEGECVGVNEARRLGVPGSREIWPVSCRLSLVPDDDCSWGVVTPC